MTQLLEELLDIVNEETQGIGDKSYYKVKNIKENDKGRIQFTGYKERNGKFVNVGVFTAKKGTPEDELWKEIDDHFKKFDDGAED